jgi:uncharacterized protein
VPYTPFTWLVSRPVWWHPAVFVPAALLLPGGSVALYARFVERRRIGVREVDLTLPGWPSTARASVVHLSDLHLVRDDGWTRHVVRAIRRAPVAEHDVGVVTGDFLYKGARPAEVARRLRDLPRPARGWFAVRGGWENSCGIVQDRFVDFCEDAGMTPLINETAQLDLAGHSVNLVGLDDPEGGRPDLVAALMGADPTVPTIVLVHRPDLLDRVAGAVDLVLAGHSHGGQVRLPGVGPVWLPKGCRRYVDGVYRKDGTTLFVSRGIGTTIAPLRLMSPPEIAILRLRGDGRPVKIRPVDPERGSP